MGKPDYNVSEIQLAPNELSEKNYRSGQLYINLTKEGCELLC